MLAITQQPTEKENTMKTLLKHTPKKSALPTLTQIMVKDGFATCSDCDFFLTYPMVGLENGLYNPAGFGTVYSKLENSDISTFPVIREAEYGQTVEYSAKWLLERLELLATAMSKDATRYYLQGVFFTGNDIAATNGQVLHKVKNTATINGSFIIPDKAIYIMIDLLKEHKKIESVKLEFAKYVNFSYMRFTCGDAVLVSKLIDGQFPNYTRVIPDCAAFAETKIDAVVVKSHLPRLKIKAKQGNEKLMVVTTNDVGISTSIDIGFNFELLLKMPSGDFFYKNAAESAVIISPLGLSVIMPMRL